MRPLLCPSKLVDLQPLLVALLLLCLGIATPPSVAQPPAIAVAQADAADPSSVKLLKPGDRGDEVTTLQEKLKQLGYFEGELDGDYGVKTKTAVAKFQESEGLMADGIAGATTLNRLDDAIAAQQAAANTEAETAENAEAAAADAQPKNSNRRFWLLGGAVATFILASLGLIILLSAFSKAMQPPQLEAETEDEANSETAPAAIPPAPAPTSPSENNANSSPEDYLSEPWFTDNPPTTSKFVAEPKPEGEMNLPRAAIATPLPAPEPRPVESPPPQTALALPAPSHLPKLDLIEELIKDLQEPHPDKRRKAIWELAQRADSRAVQPLIGLLIDSDSQQRGLILEALSQIGSRTLKPMNRALTIALQDENAQVRKNAIRDLTQMYELIAKLSKLLYLAVDDPDPEVQETAKWALNQLNNLKVPNVGDRDS